MWLLRDIRDVFVGKGADRLSSAALAASLNEIETSPWGDIRARLSTREGSHVVSSGSRSGPGRSASTTRRRQGLPLEQFEDAFSRYLAI